MFIESSFKPAWWLNNSHLQTLFPALLRFVSAPEMTRERITTPDNDFIDVDFCGDNQDEPLVILLHGLTGSAQSGYIKGLQHALLNQGFRSAALNFRGCSGEFNRTSRCYHSGETGDIHFLYQTLRAREPNTAIAVVGFSLGGNVLLKWLGEQQGNLDLFAATAVSVPLVLSYCANRLDNGFSKVYRANLLRELKDYVRLKRNSLEQQGISHEAKILQELGDLNHITSFWQYDDQVVAKLYHFKNVNDYYQRSSSRQYLKSIRIPTLIIQAHDDPFMTPEVIPQADEFSASVQMELTKSGGHVGFVSGGHPLKAEFWLEKRIPEFLHQQLSNIAIC